MEQKPMFSIIIPTYNVKEYLKKCIESIESQEYSDFEIILVDDGSTDGTSEICDALSDKYQNIFLIHQSNMGLSIARNTGIEKAKGQYCMLVDSDDFICQNSLKKLAECIKERKYPDVVAIKNIDYDIKSGEMKECRYSFEEKTLDKLNRAQQYRELWKLPGYAQAAWLYVVSMEYLRNKELYFAKGLLHEDEEWVPRVFLNAKTIAFLDFPVYCDCLNREGSIMNVFKIKRLFDCLKIIEMLQREFSLPIYTEEIRDTAFQRTRMICFSIIGNMQIYKNADNYPLLKNRVYEYYPILKTSERIVHRIAYYGIKIFGLDIVAFILYKCKGNKG